MAKCCKYSRGVRAAIGEAGVSTAQAAAAISRALSSAIQAYFYTWRVRSFLTRGEMAAVNAPARGVAIA